jgi:hypothetical protein
MVTFELTLSAMSTFKDYLLSKKIDPTKFSEGNMLLYNEFESHFAQMHETSFTAQKLFLLNKTRRTYTLVEDEQSVQPKKVAKIKPRIIPKIKK